MRKLFAFVSSAALLAAAVVVLGAPSPADASVLNWAGTNTLLLGDFPRSNRVRGGGVATINKTSGLGHIQTLRLAASRGNVRGDFTQLVTDPDTVGNSIAAIEYDMIEVQTGTFADVSGAALSSTTLTQNTMAVNGTVRLCLVTTDCQDFLELQLNQGPNTGVGIGGLLTIGADSNIKISIEAAPWTVKTVTVTDQITTVNEANRVFVDVKLFGFAHDANSATTNTASPSGVVQLVTPSQVRTNLPLGSNQSIASGQTLFIHFIPEPGLLLLLGSGVAGLAILGRRRLRK